MMKNRSLYYIIVLLIIQCIYSGCSPNKLGGNEFIKFVENEANGLHVEKQIGNIVYQIQYKPIDYILLKEKSKKDKHSRKKELEGMQYFTLSYSLSNKGTDILKSELSSKDEYFERINYLSYGLQKDIFLVEGGDTLACQLFNHVRSYGLSPKAEFVLAFDNNKTIEPKDKLVIIEDKVFGGGIIKIKLSASDIRNIPELI